MKAPRSVQGDGYRFDTPAGWAVTRAGTSVAATHGSEAVSVTTFGLTKRYRPALWKEAVAELDGVAAKLAAELHGSVTSSGSLTVGGATARRYEIGFAKGGDSLVERITFVLRGRREYELLCRFKAGKDEPACTRLLESFRPS